MEFQKLKELREDKELTQKEVAAKLNVALGTYAMNELGHDTITITNLVKYCDIFNVSIDYIFELNNIKNYPNSQKGFNKDTLKTRLKDCRKENKYTQVKIGELLNIDHSVWCRYEQGKTTITTSFLYTFCQTFNISADYLLGKIDFPKYLK